MSDLFNGHLLIYKGAQPRCRVCGHVQDLMYPNLPSNRIIVKDLRESGWHAGSKGMVCKSCWESGRR